MLLFHHSCDSCCHTDWGLLIYDGAIQYVVEPCWQTVNLSAADRFVVNSCDFSE
jgi:hypothetical protein